MRNAIWALMAFGAAYAIPAAPVSAGDNGSAARPGVGVAGELGD